MAKTKGLVIKEQTVGESDRLVTLLTADYGLVNAFVRGAKQLKNRLAASTSLFAYSEFSIYQGKNANVVDGANPIEVFFDLRKDIERLAVAQYFAQLAFELANEPAVYLRAASAPQLILRPSHCRRAASSASCPAPSAGSPLEE